MTRLSARQWLLLIAVVLVGVIMQVAWVVLRTDPPRRAQPAPSSVRGADDAAGASGGR